MQPSLAVTVFACADRNVRGFSFKADGSDLPARVDGGLWIAIASIFRLLKGGCLLTGTRR